MYAIMPVQNIHTTQCSTNHTMYSNYCTITINYVDSLIGVYRYS